MLQWLQRFQELGTLILMGGGGLLDVLINFLLFRTYDWNWNMFFIILLFFAIIIPFVVHSTLPHVIRTRQISEELILGWKTDVKKGKNSYARKKVASLFPMTCYVGIGGYHFFPLVKNVKSQFYRAIFENTVNLLMGSVT